MLGGGGSCGGPVSWWCSEAWKCSPKVAPNITPATSPMSDCDQCNAKFTLLKRRRVCNTCGLVFCGSCIKRVMGGTRSCNKCLVLSQWPLEISEVAALRVKDLRHFLHSQHINTTACTEKRDLIELVTRHISTKHRGTDATGRQRTPLNGDINTVNANLQPNYTPPPHFTTTSDDGIRVRPSNILPFDTNNGSIRVRAVASTRVRPDCPLSPDTNGYDPEADFGIRVFATEGRVHQQDRASSLSPISAEGCSESADVRCSHCPSEDCTASCCSLDSCNNGASSRPSCPINADASSRDSFEYITDSHFSDAAASERSGEQVVNGAGGEMPIMHFNSLDSVGLSTSEAAADSLSGSQQSAVPQHSAASEASFIGFNSSYGSEVEATPVLDTHPSAPPNEEFVPTSATSSSASSSAPPSSASSPEPNKSSVSNIIPLGNLKSEEDISRLSVRQCKELLALHRVNYSGMREKSELIKKIEILWRDYQNSQQDIEAVPEEMVCKICMDSIIDCVLLECGHMVACTQCGKQMSECPVCRQYVVRVVRTFRA